MKLKHRLIAFAGPVGSDKSLLSEMLGEITGLPAYSYDDSNLGAHDDDGEPVTEGVIMNVSSQGRVDAVKDNGGMVIHVINRGCQKRTAIKRSKDDLVINVSYMKPDSMYKVLTRLHENSLVDHGETETEDE